MQITRQRVRPEVTINTAEVCPSCNGTGKVTASILVANDIDRDLNFIMQSHPKSKLSLHVHPFLAAYFKQGLPSLQMKWFMKYYKWVQVVGANDFSVTDYKFFENNEDEIRL